MTKILQPDDMGTALAEINRRLDRLERTETLGKATTQGGTTHWQDSNGVDQIVVGKEADGTYGVWVNGIKLLSATNVVLAPGGLNTGDRNFKFVKTSSTRLDITTS